MESFIYYLSAVKERKPDSTYKFANLLYELLAEQKYSTAFKNINTPKQLINSALDLMQKVSSPWEKRELKYLADLLLLEFEFEMFCLDFFIKEKA